MINELYDEKLTSQEIDIQVQGTALFDYLIDGLIVSATDEFQIKRLHDYRSKARIQFGDKVVQLVRAINACYRNTT